MARAHVSAVTMPPAARRASPCGRMWYSFAPVWSQDVIEPREQQQALATLKTPRACLRWGESALRRAGVRFGLSTHDDAELERALSLDPAYVALGPVYPTLLKKMKWAPQGLDRVTAWKRRTGQVPLVAIGGLTPERAPGVLAAGADSLAVVTDVQQAEDPEARVRDWLYPFW